MDRQGPAAVLVRSVLAAVVLVLLLLACAGSWQWWNAWVLGGLLGAIGTATGLLLARSPELAQERRTAAQGAPGWDRVMVRVLNVMLPVELVLAGMDARWGWSGVLPVAVVAVGVVLALLGSVVTWKAMQANRFFSSHVRIQQDRGHQVVDTGAYGVVRHPGYAGAVLFNAAVPLVLGSVVALTAGVAAVVVLVVRTAWEDRHLQEHLPGYADYAKRVRFRLVPGVW